MATTVHQPSDEPLNAALRYAAAGWPVLACKPGRGDHSNYTLVVPRARWLRAVPS